MEVWVNCSFDWQLLQLWRQDLLVSLTEAALCCSAALWWRWSLFQLLLMLTGCLLSSLADLRAALQLTVSHLLYNWLYQAQTWCWRAGTWSLRGFGICVCQHDSSGFPVVCPSLSHCFFFFWFENRKLMKPLPVSWEFSFCADSWLHSQTDTFNTKQPSVQKYHSFYLKLF